MGDLLNVDMNYLIGKKESTEIIPDSYYLNPEARGMAQFLSTGISEALVNTRSSSMPHGK